MEGAEDRRARKVQEDMHVMEASLRLAHLMDIYMKSKPIENEIESDDNKMKLRNTSLSEWSSIVKSLLEDESNRQNMLLSCASILLTLQKLDFKKALLDKDSGGAGGLQHILISALAKCLFSNGDKSSDKMLVVEYTLVELLLAMPSRSHRQVLESVCELLSNQLVQYLAEEAELLHNEKDGIRIELLLCCWIRLPQLKEMLQCNSKTKGLIGEKAWKEQLAQSCSIVGKKITLCNDLGICNVPQVHIQKDLQSMILVWKHISELFQYQYSFQCNLNVMEFLESLSSCIGFCMNVLVMMDNPHDAIHLSNLVGINVDCLALLARATRHSIIPYLSDIIETFSLAFNFSSSNLMLQTPEGIELCSKIIIACTTYMKVFGFAFALKLDEKVFTLACVILECFSKLHEGNLDQIKSKIEAGHLLQERVVQWCDHVYHALRFLCTICNLTSSKWPSSQMQYAIQRQVSNISLLLISGTLFAKKNLPFHLRKKLDILAVEACSVLRQFALSQEKVYSINLERYLDIFQRGMKSQSQGVLDACSTAINGCQTITQPVCIHKWNVLKADLTDDMKVLPESFAIFGDIFMDTKEEICEGIDEYGKNSPTLGANGHAPSNAPSLKASNKRDKEKEIRPILTNAFKAERLTKRASHFGASEIPKYAKMEREEPDMKGTTQVNTASAVTSKVDHDIPSLSYIPLQDANVKKNALKFSELLSETEDELSIDSGQD